MKERILIAIDLNIDTEKLNSFKPVLKSFIRLKQQISMHDIGILQLTNETSWQLPFTNQISEIESSINEIYSLKSNSWSVKSFIDIINDCIDDKESFHVILCYARSDALPIFDLDLKAFLKMNPNCTIDIMYIHDSPSETCDVQRIYDSLSAFENDKSRSFEVKKTNSRRSMLAMAELLGNPMQRSTKDKAHYHQI